ncbi:MAG: DUF1963 domain-containing protein [Bacilli bacterium]|nr:DUF1963 domain-containing protein [Bacilli bacterium]
MIKADYPKIFVLPTTDQVTDVVENFNEPYDDKDFMTPFYLTFEEREEIVTGEGISFSSQDGTKLLGFPYDNISGHKVDLDEILLFQIDPLSCVDFPFLSNSDGIGYVFIKLDDLKKKNFENIKFLVEKSK